MKNISQERLASGPTNDANRTPYEAASVRQVIFGIIASFSFLLNFLFCVIMIRKPNVLKKPHNILLFSLAITDILTAIFLLLTPDYVISVGSFPVPRGLAGKIFCHVVGSRYALFTMGKVSILKVTCLAIERWFSIFQPIRYKLRFTRKRLLLHIVAIWVCTCALQINKLVEWKLVGTKCRREMPPYGEKGSQAMVFIYSLIGFYIPCFIAWASFAHIALLFKTSPMARCYNKRKTEQQKALLRMCALTSVALTLCWMPSQTCYILFAFKVLKAGKSLHQTLGILAMFNSCINPLIYWSTNKLYRNDLFDLLKIIKIKPCKITPFWKRSY